MRNSKHWKIGNFVAAFAVGFLIFIMSPVSAKAATIISRTDTKLDDNLVKVDQNFASPKSIIVFPIERPDVVLDGDKDWFRALYYFYTARLGFPDIPFHFIVASNGEVYEGNKGGDEQSVLIKGEDAGALIVGYLAEQGESNFSARAFSSMEETLLELANRNSIKPENIKITGYETVVNLEDKTVFLRSKLF